MTAPTTTQLQLGAHRFAARRLERALRCGQPAGGPAPGRAGLGLGCLISVIVVAGALVLAVVRPQPGLGDAPILLDRASGALYVRVGDTVHPVFNLASARLIAGPTTPRPVAGTEISRARRGPPLGIPGAPGALGAALAATATWSLCDDPAGTTLIAGADPLHPAGIDADEAVPVSSESAAVYLVRRGRRTPVNPADPVLESAAPRRVSSLLLNAVPEAPPAKDFAGRVAEWPAAAVTLCAHWRADDPVGVTLSAGVGLPLPTGATPTVLAQADGPGPALDAVYLPPGRSAYLRAAGVSGRTGGAGYLIDETGVRFTVEDTAAARSLGLPETPAGVPWPMLAGLPAGPRLSREQALLAHDVVLPAPGR
ncbi:type VII secretion protein EccB [Mycolicibacter sinensis]|uniref:Type VII secretion protein EccB n=1 Tax=Mycolicibacter sinensis (strain JDM601) TaxID=875328 RepID=A0A1A2Y319_MYCSD|nr:type VII secretion protein EccB [Mycolicibacter sinensis]OBH16012.1 type VII secretion protein EccB [Mycolicibacter sinensis]OBI31712.1 type VII secretion protein EccB [Mycolicibacter sinensis]